MGADAVLAQGAYDAKMGKSASHWKQKEHDKLMEIIQQVSKFDPKVSAQQIVNNGGSLPPAEKASVRKQVQNMQDKYVDPNATDEEKEKLLAEVGTMGVDYGDKWKNMRLQYASNNIGNRLSAGFTRTPRGKEWEKLLGDQASLIKKECEDGTGDCENYGQMGLTMSDEKVIADTTASMQNIQAQIKNQKDLYETQGITGGGEELDILLEKLEMHQKVLDSNPTRWHSLEEANSFIKLSDVNTKNVIEELRKSQFDLASDLTPEDEYGNYEANIRQIIKNSVLGKTHDPSSFVYDSMIDGRTFESDFLKSVMGNVNGEGRKWSDFGVTAEMLGKGDTTPDGVIDGAEGSAILMAIEKDNELMMEIKEDYIYKHIDKNIQLGLATRRKTKTSTSNENTDTDTSTDNSNNGSMYSRFLNSDDDDEENDNDASMFGGYKKGEL